MGGTKENTIRTRGVMDILQKADRNQIECSGHRTCQPSRCCRWTRRLPCLLRKPNSWNGGGRGRRRQETCSTSSSSWHHRSPGEGVLSLDHPEGAKSGVFSTYHSLYISGFFGTLAQKLKVKNYNSSQKTQNSRIFRPKLKIPAFFRNWRRFFNKYIEFCRFVGPRNLAPKFN